ncbi:scavenger receptor cysteine-rich type 1 protein M130-like [Branchiostoma floridae x Branchiostoma japonicum]
MASVVLLAVLVLCVSFPARAQDVRPHQEYVDNGYCTYTYVVPPGSRTGSFSPPRLEEQLAETKEETGRLRNEVDLLVQTLLSLQSDLSSRVDSLRAELSEEKVRSAQLEQNLTRELQEQETRLQTQVQNLTQELQEQETRLQTQVQNLTQALQEQETRLQTQVQNLTTTFYEHDVIIKQQLQLVPDDVITTLPSDAVPTAVTPITRITSPTKLQPATRNTKSPAAENITTTQPGTVRPATEPTGSVIGMQLQVRLVDGSTLLEGRVEVRNGTGQWGSVCDDNFDLQDAHVVCRRLGFGAALEVKLAGHFGEGSGNVWLDEVSCRGNETDLGDCPADSWGRSDCSHKEDAGVVSAGDAALRLVGSRVPWKGRLQIRPWGALEWGAVCNTGWTEAEAGFVCRQMGYTGGVTSSGQADIGEGSEIIWLGDVTCSGDETNILLCGFSWEPSDCDHSQDVQLVCTGGVSLQLVGGQSLSEGRLEVRSGNGDWGTVCDDGFDDRDAQVVCRQLGYGAGFAKAGGGL